MVTPRKALWRMIVVAVLTTALFIGVANALRNPVEGDTATYTAEFTDVSGLRPGADVRRQGVQIGKVTGIDLQRTETTTIAVVEFELRQDEPLTAASRMAVKYQNLSGLRYLDLTTDDAQPDRTPRTRIPLTATTGSFDITTLFHGLEPVLATLAPEQVNRLAAGVLALLNGAGGVEELTAGVRAIADYATDRQHTVSVLVANIGKVAQTMRGRSPQVLEFIRDFQLAIDRTMTVLDEFYKTAQYGPPFVDAVNRLLTGLGLHEGGDLDGLLRTALSAMTDAPALLRLLPTVSAGLEQLDGARVVDMHCGRGEAELPPAITVLLGGQRVVLCRR